MYCSECKAYKKNDYGCKANLSSYLINGMLGCHEADLLLDAYHFGQIKDNTTTSNYTQNIMNEKLVCDILPDQVYKHYKGNIYVVLHIAKHTETEEDMVVYTRFGTVDDTVWVRPLSMWNDIVEINGEKQPRFKLLY